MVRTIIQQAKNKITLQLPTDLVGKTVEVIAFELEDTIVEPKSPLKPSQMRGFLSAETAEKMQAQIQKDRDEWSA